MNPTPAETLLCSPRTANGYAARPAAPPSLEEQQRREQAFFEAYAENKDYWEAHEQELLGQHPEWRGKYVVIASRLANKIVAVVDDSMTGWEVATQALDVKQLAEQLQVPADCLVYPFFLGDILFDS